MRDYAVCYAKPPEAMSDFDTIGVLHVLASNMLEAMEKAAKEVDTKEYKAMLTVTLLEDVRRIQ